MMNLSEGINSINEFFNMTEEFVRDRENIYRRIIKQNINVDYAKDILDDYIMEFNLLWRRYHDMMALVETEEELEEAIPCDNNMTRIKELHKLIGDALYK